MTQAIGDHWPRDKDGFPIPQRVKQRTLEEIMADRFRRLMEWYGQTVDETQVTILVRLHQKMETPEDKSVVAKYLRGVLGIGDEKPEMKR